MVNINKEYMGDGIYADWNENSRELILTTENGMEVTNTITIELEYWINISRFMLKIIERHPRMKELE